MQAFVNNLDLFCGETPWEPDIFSSTTIPILSRCMQHTILTWIPTLFTILIAPLIAIQFSTEKNQPLPWAHLLSAKLSLTCVLILDSAFLFLLAFYESVNGSVVKPVDFIYPSLQFLSMVLIGTFIFACQRRGKVTSRAIWINWLLYTICGLPELYYFWSLNDATSIEILRLIGFAIWYSGVVTQLLLCSHDYLWKRDEEQLEERVYIILEKWEKLWNSAMTDYNTRKGQVDKEVKPPSISWRLFIVFKGDIILAMIIKCASDLLQFANPLLLSALIRFTENLALPLWYGVGLAIMMFVVSELSSIMINNHYDLMYQVGTRIQEVLTAAVYKQTWRALNDSRRAKVAERVLELINIDVDHFKQVTPSIQQYWSTPMQIFLALYLLFHQVGYSVIAAVVVMLLLLPINFVIAMQTLKYKREQMAAKDKRVKCVNEILNGMKVIKLYAYEEPMEDAITKLRNEELIFIKKAAFLRTFSDMLNTASPFFVAASTFTTFLFSDASNILTPEIAFVSLTLFNQLRAPMSTIAELISQTVQVYVSNDRLQKFLVFGEIEDPSKHKEEEDRSQNVINVNNEEVKKVETGRVKSMIYLSYFKAIGFKLSSLFLFGMIASTVASMTKDLWLTDWSNNAVKNSGAAMSIGTRLGIYAALGFAEVALASFGMSLLLSGGVSASRNLHSPLLHTILRAPMKFFDITPRSLILDRVGKDIETIDYVLPSNVEAFVDCVLQIISTLVIIMISTPIFGIVVLTVLCLIILRYYIATSGQPKRYLNYVTNQWLSIRLQFIGNCVVLFAALFAVLIRGSTSVGVLGLFVCHSIKMSLSLNFAVRQISKLETNIISVERVKEYSEVETEAAWIIPEKRAPIGWPSEAKVEFKDYSAHYHRGLDLVIREITANISPGQKVGIVGETGAGKRSLTLAIFRMVEPASGTILIDGVDIQEIGLHDLRSNITFIPQEPVLFSGTIRFNLDPFESFLDVDLWQALEMARVKDFVSDLTRELNYKITEGGEEIPVDKRRLICLARALLRKSKLIVLDQVITVDDVSTDRLIQKIICQEFANSTVLTIAHCLDTIMDYDLIIVLKEGKIAKFGSPQELLADKRSLIV